MTRLARGFTLIIVPTWVIITTLVTWYQGIRAGKGLQCLGLFKPYILEDYEDALKTCHLFMCVRPS